MKKKLAIIIAFLALLFLGIFGIKSGFTFRQVFRETNALEHDLPEPTFTPVADPGRLNVLLLGIRGAEDPNGGLLSDAIVLVSVERDTGSAALISLPRDIYVPLPSGTNARLNAAYALGEMWRWGGGGLVWARRAAEYVSGVRVDSVLSVDFTAFEKVVETLGGVSVTLKAPFEERTQWSGYPRFASSSGAFYLSAGSHLLDGETALFYVRSRFSSSDFDRARRIQAFLISAKDKALSLGVLGNPVKVFRLMDVIGNHVRTDASRDELRELAALLSELRLEGARRLVLDTSPEGLLKEEHINGAYVLLPMDGTFEEIRAKAKNIFSM